MNLMLQKILDYCHEKNIKITPQQQLILATINDSPLSVTINEILLKLKEINPRANRMTIHRGLEYLSKVELIHKIASNHTYTLCNQLSYKDDSSCQILVCQKCSAQIELHSSLINNAVINASQKHHFTIMNPLEITGYCDKCL